MKHHISSLFLSISIVLASNCVLADSIGGLDLERQIGSLKPLEPAAGFQPPVRLSSPRPIYPKDRYEKQHSGIVELRFMVEEDGSITEAVVVYSTHPDFEESALNVAQKFVYEPATWNGVPTKSSWAVRVVYELSGPQGSASAQFVRPFKRAKKELDKAEPKQERVRRNLDQASRATLINMYSLSFLFIEEYRYAVNFLSRVEQLHALEQLLLFDDRLEVENQVLGPEAVKSARMNILQLLIQLGRYGEARNAYHSLKRDAPEAAQRFSEPMGQVLKILESDEVLMRDLEIKPRGNEFIYLTKNSFEIHQVEGRIDRVNFYCSLGFQSLEFQEESNYTIPNSWGSCNLLIVGEPGTTAKLYQN